MSPRAGKLYSGVGCPDRAGAINSAVADSSIRFAMRGCWWNNSITTCCFRCFVGMSMDEPMLVATVFTKKSGPVAEALDSQQFLCEVCKLAQPYLSDEHFKVSGILIEAWASQKSFQRRQGGSGRDGEHFHGDQRSNETQQYKTEADARRYRTSGGNEAIRAIPCGIAAG